MTDPIDRLTRALEGARAVADRVIDRDVASQCSVWSIADVTRHLIAVTDKFTRFAGDAPIEPSPDMHAAAERAVRTWLANPGALERTCTLSFGTFDGSTAAGINAFDAVVHGWDVASVAGLPYEPDDDLVDASIQIAELLVWDERQYARPPRVRADSSLERLLILTGRDPRQHRV